MLAGAGGGAGAVTVYLITVLQNARVVFLHYENEETCRFGTREHQWDTAAVVQALNHRIIAGMVTRSYDCVLKYRPTDDDDDEAEEEQDEKGFYTVRPPPPHLQA